MAVVTVFVRIEEGRDHQNRERVKSRRHVRELRLPARASQALVREMWRSGNRKRRKGVGCRKRQKIRRQARRSFNSELASSLAAEWRRRRLRERSARSLARAWHQFQKREDAKKLKIDEEQKIRQEKGKAAMMSGIGACPAHVGCYCVLYRGDWYAPPDDADENNLAARPRRPNDRRKKLESPGNASTKSTTQSTQDRVNEAKEQKVRKDGSPADHRRKRKKKGNKKSNKSNKAGY